MLLLLMLEEMCGNPQEYACAAVRLFPALYCNVVNGGDCRRLPARAFGEFNAQMAHDDAELSSLCMFAYCICLCIVDR